MFSILPFLSLGIHALKLLYYFIDCPYTSIRIQEIEFGFSFVNLIFSCLLIAGQFRNNSLDFSILVICTVPLSYIASYFVQRQRIISLMQYLLLDTHSNRSQDSDSFSEKQLQKLCLSLKFVFHTIDFSLSSYLKSPYSIFLEQIITKHIETCTLYPDCFCKQKVKIIHFPLRLCRFPASENLQIQSNILPNSFLNFVTFPQDSKTAMTKDEFLEENQRKQYIEHYILGKFQEQLKNPNNNNAKHEHISNFYFSYLAYLINGLKKQTTSLREVFILRAKIKHAKPNFQQTQMINYVYQLACKEFNLGQKTNEQEKADIIDVIQFDESLEQCSMKLHECLTMKLLFLETISKDYINLQNLEKQANKLQNKKTKLEKGLLKLLRINSKYSYLYDICEGFQECLSIELTFSEYVHNLNKSGRANNNILLQSEDATAVYITLLSDIGKIVKVSRNFNQLLQIIEKNSSAVGQNVKIMMCEEVAAFHDAILLDCIHQRAFNQSIMPSRLLIGRSKNGWALPLDVKMQMCTIGTEELGACALIKKVSNSNMHMQTASIANQLRIYLVDQQLHDILFCNLKLKSEIKKIRISRISPLISVLLENMHSGQICETVIIKPSSFQNGMMERNISDQYFFENLMREKLCTIRFLAHVNRKAQFVQFQILFLKELNDLTSKKDAIKNLAYQIKQYTNVQVKQKTIFELKKQYSGDISPIIFQREKSSSSRGNFVDKNQTPFIVAIKVPQGTSEQSNNVAGADMDIANNEPGNSKILSMETADEELEIQDKRKNQKIFYENYFHNTLIEGERGSIAQELNSLQTDRLSSPFILGQPVRRDDLINNFTLDSNNKKEISKVNQTPTNIENLSNQLNIVSELACQSPYSSRPLLEQTFYTLDLRDSAQNQSGLQSPTKNKYRQQTSINDNISPMNQPYVKKYNGKKNMSPTATFYPLTVIKESQVLQSSSDPDNEFKKDNCFLKDDNENSINSTQTKTSTNKLQIIKVIKSTKHKGSLRMISLIGIVALVIIASLNIISFFILANDRNDQKRNFQKIFWCFQMRRYIGFILGLTDTFKGLNSGFYYFPAPIYRTQFIQLTYGANVYIYSGLRNVTIEMLEGNPNEIYIFKGIMDYQLEQQNMNIISTLTESTSKTSLYYKIAQWTTYAYYMVFNLDKQNLNVNMAVRNYDDILDALITVQDDSFVEFYDKIRVSKLILLLQLIFITIVTGILTFLTIPIYILNQKSREKILKLFATLSIDQLTLMTSLANFYSEKIENEQNLIHKNKVQKLSQFTIRNQNYSKSEQTMNKKELKRTIKQNGGKKRNLSSTSSLPIFKFNLVPGLLICLVCTLFNPFATYFLTLKAIDSFDDSISFLSANDYYFDNIVTLFSLKYSYCYARLTDPTQPYVASLSKKILSIFSETDKYYNNLQTTFLVYENKNLYQREEYDNFLLPMFKGDLCSAIQNSTEDFREIKIDLKTCSTIANGMFKKGLFVAITKCQELVKQFVEALSLTTSSQFNAALLKMQQTLIIQYEFVFFQYTAYFSKMVAYFFQDRYSDYQNYIFSLNKWFLLIQLVLLMLVLFLGWNKFYAILENQYFVSKQLFNLISIDILMENSYIASYFKNRR